MSDTKEAHRLLRGQLYNKDLASDERADLLHIKKEMELGLLAIILDKLPIYALEMAGLQRSDIDFAMALRGHVDGGRTENHETLSQEVISEAYRIQRKYKEAYDYAGDV